jgi:hypothetical protein
VEYTPTKDYLGNNIAEGDTVIIAVKQGKYAMLSRGYVKQIGMKKMFGDGDPVAHVEVEWSNLHKFWIPASKVISVPDNMLPEKRREKLEETNEAEIPL